MSATPPPTPGRPRLTLIHLNPVPGAEWDWLQLLLSRFELDVIFDPEGAHLVPGALYAYYNDKPVQLPAGFLEKVAKLPGCGFLHCGDEYFRADMSVYAAFDYVIRSPWTELLAGPGVMGIPIGPSNNMAPRAMRPASQRKLVWSFAGGRRLSRLNMARIFKDLTPHLASLPDTARGEKHISRADYLDALADSMFVPCVEGNVILETLRPYEALNYGAIPLLPKRPLANTWPSILGRDHPIPTFGTWTEAARFVATLKANPQQLDRLQADVTAWWDRYRAATSDRLADFIGRGARGEMSEALRVRFRSWGGPAWQARRMWELTRQQGGGQIRERFERLPHKIIAKVQGKSAAGEWSLGATATSTGTDKGKKT